MRYMFLISSVEDLKPPPARLMEEIDKLSKQPDVASRMVGQGGLFPLSMAGARIRLKGGKLHVMDGPFAETKEVLGGFAIFEVDTNEEALASAIKFMELHRLHGEGWEGLCEMRPMFPEEHGGCAATAESMSALVAAQ